MEVYSAPKKLTGPVNGIWYEESSPPSVTMTVGEACAGDATNKWPNARNSAANSRSFFTSSQSSLRCLLPLVRQSA